MMTNLQRVGSKEPIRARLYTGGDPLLGPLYVEVPSGGLTTGHSFWTPVSSWKFSYHLDQDSCADIYDFHCHCHQDQNGIQTWCMFSCRRELQLFQEMIRLDGIGWKVALKLISKATFDKMISAIEAGDATALAELPGMSGKQGSTVVDYLSKKFALKSLQQPVKKKPDPVNQDAVMALTVMGANKKDATSLVQKAQEALGPNATTEEIVKAALRKP